jgi:cellulose synthase (UDP-forming)
MSEPTVFFDIIQRRRNRNGASFCCGAGSIHRREAIFDAALKRKAADAAQLSKRYGSTGLQTAANSLTLEPYRFHVSEDIYTSILLHSDAERKWKSVYHPQAEARMLSPWSMRAWATQRLKYAGGTFDIMLRDNPLFKSGMPWRTKLHYASTFWSYLTALWTPVLLLAPAFSLLTGLAPVRAYSTEFFLHFLPMVVLGELAMLAACKGYGIGGGRALAISTLHIQLRALWLVLNGKRPKFPPTPKTPGAGAGYRFIWPNILLLAGLALSGITGAALALTGSEHHSSSLLVVNLFWLSWNMFLVSRITFAAGWKPLLNAPSPKQALPPKELSNA